MSTLFRTAALVLAALVAGRAAAQGTGGASPLDPGGFNRAGRTGFQFLKIGVGARQAALGEASAALVRDAGSAFWNPAGITGIERHAATLSYTRWLADMNYVGAAIGTRVEGVGTFALSVAALDYGAIPEAIVNGQPDGRTGNTVSGGDLVAGLSYARQFTDRLAVGVTAKYLHESLWVYGAGAFAFDVGTNYDVGWRGVRLAMSAQNLGGSAHWLPDSLTDRQEGYDLPLVFRMGTSAPVVGPDALVPATGPHRLVAAVEGIHTNDFSERVHVGAEYVYDDLLAVRGGYRFNYDEGNWAVGVGLMPRFGDVRLSIDYAYVGYRFLDAPHRFSISFAY